MMKKIYMKPECRAIYPTETRIILDDSPTQRISIEDEDSDVNDDNKSGFKIF